MHKVTTKYGYVDFMKQIVEISMYKAKISELVTIEACKLALRARGLLN